MQLDVINAAVTNLHLGQQPIFFQLEPNSRQKQVPNTQSSGAHLLCYGRASVAAFGLCLSC